MRRRRFVAWAGTLTAGVSGLAGCGSEGPAVEDDAGTEPAAGTATTGTASDGPATTYELGGKVQAWTGRAPRGIEGRANPTLELTAGETAVIAWENLDGQPHALAIQDDDGDHVETTEETAEAGTRLSLSFTVSSELSQYVCTVHPSTMVGEITVSDG